jgi:hypothetical protein
MTSHFAPIRLSVSGSKNAVRGTRRPVDPVLFVAACQLPFIHFAPGAKSNIASSDEAGLIAAINDAIANGVSGTDIGGRDGDGVGDPCTARRRDAGGPLLGSAMLPETEPLNEAPALRSEPVEELSIAKRFRFGLLPGEKETMERLRPASSLTPLTHVPSGGTARLRHGNGHYNSVNLLW